MFRIIGPLNSDVTLLSGPPSTLIERAIDASVALVTLRSGRSPISSPVTVWIGVSIISSSPVNALIFLLPLNDTPLSFIPV